MVVLGLLLEGACGGGIDGAETNNAALSAPDVAGPIYLVEQQAFKTGQYKVVDGFARQGARALLETLDNSKMGQKWTISQTGELRSSDRPNLCLDVRGDIFRHGTPVETWPCNGQNNQKWYIEAAQSGSAQFGVIRPVGHTRLCLDAHGAATVDGTSLQLWYCNSQENQHWALFSAG
jgi:alpha-galactosidase